MWLSKIKFPTVLVIILVFALTISSVVYSDSQNGWKGYGLYNINDSKISIVNEDISIELENGKLKLSGEYVVRNMTNSEIKVSLGMPANGIEKISMMENGYYIKWKKRSLESLQNEFKLDNKLPQESYWYVFNLALNPAETRIINVRLDALQQSDEKGTYSISYFGDRKLGFSNQVEKSSLYIKIAGFEPYNILSVKGFDPIQMGKKGEMLIETDEKNMEAIAIQHKGVMDQAINVLLKSPMHKPREIALAFLAKNYDRASYLCDEYIKNPSDNQINKEQILFVKAESIRRLYKIERYLQLIESMDYSKLYPAELKNKILLDRMNIYLAQSDQEKIDNLSKEIFLMTDESSELLAAWMEDNGYFDPAKVDKAKLLKDKQNQGQDVEKATTIIGEWYRKIMILPYTPAIIFIAGLLAGLLMRRTTGKKRKKRSMYVYRM